jgi:hypothetical protein
MFVFWYFLPLFGQTTSISITVFTLLWAHASMSDKGTKGASSTGKGSNMLGCHGHQDIHLVGGSAYASLRRLRLSAGIRAARSEQRMSP